ncbi:alpha/beta fold hydrolase [Microbacterium sp. GXF7504]
MVECLAATGTDVAGPLILGLLALLAGVGAVVLHRTGRRRGVRGGALLVVAALAVSGVAVIGSAGPAQAASDPCDETPVSSVILPDQDVSFISGGVAFAASLRAPAPGRTGVPAAIIIGGTGAVDRDGNGAGLEMDQYRWIADLLSAQGIASLRYDKLGTGATGLGPYAADPSAMLPLTYEQLRVQPARDALTSLAAVPGVDPNRLIVIGHSEGGAVATLVVTEPKGAPAAAGLALVEPAYTHILDIVSRQFADQMDAAATGGAMDPADVATLKTWLDAGVAEIRGGTPPYPVPGPVPLPGATDFTALMQTTIQDNIYGSDPAQMVITHAYRTLYGKGYDAVDPADLVPAIGIPTLITCGTKDFNTPCGDGTPGSGVIALSQAFTPGVARFVTLPDTVHILRDVGDADVPNIADQLAYPYSAVFAAEFSAFVATFRG